MATIRHPALALADVAAFDLDLQNAALASLTQFARGNGAITRADARLVLDRIGDLTRAAAAAGWLDEREAADAGRGAA
jgi:hypothetical protein